MQDATRDIVSLAYANWRLQNLPCDFADGAAQ